MALFIRTDNPKGLLSKIKAGIDNRNIDTWTYDGDGDFTHSTEQWKNKAWLRPTIETDRLVFGIIGRKGIAIDNCIYAIYHGRFLEMLLSHFDDSINSIEISSLLNAQYDSSPLN